MEDFERYEIWKISIPFHSTACPAYWIMSHVESHQFNLLNYFYKSEGSLKKKFKTKFSWQGLLGWLYKIIFWSKLAVF